MHVSGHSLSPHYRSKCTIECYDPLLRQRSRYPSLIITVVVTYTRDTEAVKERLWQARRNDSYRPHYHTDQRASADPLDRAHILLVAHILPVCRLIALVASR